MLATGSAHNWGAEIANRSTDETNRWRKQGIDGGSERPSDPQSNLINEKLRNQRHRDAARQYDCRRKGAENADGLGLPAKVQTFCRGASGRRFPLQLPPVLIDGEHSHTAYLQ